ncbi:transcription elongation factor A protein [Faustovirus]|nr:transcription elongation factor A protein 1 [Faustovirus]QJX72168.1 transcription elongation factor A protein [Faustovirus]QJX72663.1 transcription elongation factor A protein [Faustovirus]QJX73160.1 transcription elongation factor A protein [Faustovirus]QJX73667.1 transcription elongation factor A protein [Faustovirus]
MPRNLTSKIQVDISQRVKILELIEQSFEQLKEFNELDEERATALIRRIERSCLNATVAHCEKDGIPRNWLDKSFVQVYSTECYRITANLAPDSTVGSSYLARQLIAGEVDANNITLLTSHQLSPLSTQSERDMIKRRKEQKIELKICKAYVCPKCKKNETTYREVQTRAADEAGTFFIECVTCGYSWKKKGV